VPVPTRPAVDVDACDRAYRAILAACPLSTAHREAMLARGMTATEIEADGYGTLPRGGREDLGALAAAAAGEAAAGRVPGLVPNDRGRIIVVGSAGMLVPVRDVVGRVVGLRIRVDFNTKNKYRWLSSSENDNVASISGNQPCHVALPAGWVPGETRRVIVTEGEIKAAITARKLRLPVVSLPGISCQGAVAQTIASVVGDQSISVSVAFDQEKDETKQRTTDAMRDRLCQKLIEAGYRVDVLLWSNHDEQTKGIDDLLCRGLLPMPVAYRPPETEIEVGPVVDQLRQERDAARQHAHRLGRMARNKNLGSDLAPTVAQILYTEVYAKAATNPTVDGKYRVIPSEVLAGERRENGDTVGGVVSPGTFRKNVVGWIEAGLVPVTIEKELVTRKNATRGPKVIERDVYVVDLGETNDIAALADPLCFGDMYAATGTERPRRGGIRTCQHCNGTKFRRTVELVCVDCGTMHSRSETIIEDIPSQTLRALGRDPEEVSRNEEDADDQAGDTLANFACMVPPATSSRPPEPEALRVQRARSILAALRREGHNPRLGMADQLVVDETVRPMTDHLAGEVADYRGEIELWLLADLATQDRTTA